MNNNNSNIHEIRSFIDWIMTLTPFQFTTIGTITGYILAENLTVDQQNSLGNWLEFVGQLLLTYNAQATANQCNISCDEYSELKRKIDLIMRRFNIKS